MKLQTCQLTSWCDKAFRSRRKWFWLAGNALLLLFSFLIGLDWLILPVVLLANAVSALYLLHRHHAFGAVYQRKPRPQDAQCETVLIDAALIGQGTQLRAAAQPIDVADELSLRLGSGALLLGAAMTLTADELPPADRAAILSAVQSLNIKPSRMRSHSPVISRKIMDDLTIVTVRDGMSDRRYYLGEPSSVAACCTSIWEGHARPMTDHDHLRISDTARYIAQADCRVYAWATTLGNESPVFLGIAGTGERLFPAAIEDVADLRAMGLTVMLNSDTQADTDLESLRTLLELPDHHARADIHLTTASLPCETPLGITCAPGDSLVEPVNLLRQRFRTIEDTLRRFAQTLALALIVALLTGSRLTPIFLTGMLMYAAIAIGVDLTAPRLRWPAMLGICALAFSARVFLNTQLPQINVSASGMIAVATAFSAAIRLCGRGFTLRGQSRMASLGLIGGGAAIFAALLIYGLLQGLTSLLPLGFSLLVNAAISLLMLFDSKILR